MAGRPGLVIITACDAVLAIKFRVPIDMSSRHHGDLSAPLRVTADATIPALHHDD